jgi:AraC-like DNA-binding protein
MKIKSHLLSQHTPLFEIQMDLNYSEKTRSKEGAINIKTADLEVIVNYYLMSNAILILDTKMYFTKPEIFNFEMNRESFVMNFIFCKNVEGCIENLGVEKCSQANTHNLYYTTNLKGVFKVPALEKVNYFSIILSKDYYLKIINQDYTLHDKFSKNLLQNKPSYLSTEYLPLTPAIQWIISEMKNCKRKDGLKKIYIETKTRELLLHQIEALHDYKKLDYQISNDDLTKLEKAKQIIDNDFKNAPKLNDLSRMISLNEFKLKKGFKEHFGYTVKNYIIKLRMEFAKSLLKDKNITISEVATKCGYKDLSNFSKAFKAFYTFSPQQSKEKN